MGPASDVAGVGHLSGFGDGRSSEALPGVLPVRRNSPQRLSHGVYAEQASVLAFTPSQAENQHAWLFRTHPARAAQVCSALLPNRYL